VLCRNHIVFSVFLERSSDWIIVQVKISIFMYVSNNR
jgi:hypothetical protein